MQGNKLKLRDYYSIFKMDFDTAKENIQPLRQGRRADRLEMALGEQNKESLEAEKK